MHVTKTLNLNSESWQHPNWNGAHKCRWPELRDAQTPGTVDDRL